MLFFLILRFFLVASGLAQVTFGQHHILLLDATGKVHAIGRHDYGVLGLGEGKHLSLIFFFMNIAK